MSSKNIDHEDGADALLERVNALLAEPAHTGNPLREALAEIYDLVLMQRERMTRLIRISDGYHAIERHRTSSLVDQYDRKLRHLEKLARISDRYQQSMREMMEELREASLNDPLTGVGNRRYLMQRLEEETERARRSGVAYGLAILDVDHFKQINDQFGHELGDLALRGIAQAIVGELRQYDLCGRWGGEEFLLLLPNTGIAQAREVAERTLAAVRGISLPSAGNLHLTASVGVTVCSPGEEFPPVLRRADTALYEAKRGGRDQVRVG